MPDALSDEQLDYFIAHVRLLLSGETMEGLDAWARRFGELREISEFELCQRLANAIRSSDLPEHALGVVRYGEGWLYDRMGRWREAIRAYRRSLEAFRQSRMPLDATVLNQIGSIYQDQGDWPSARDAYRQALDAGDSDDRTRGLILNNLGGLALLQDDLVAAEGHYTEARDLLRDCDRRNFAAASHGLASVLRESNRLAESQTMQIECLQVFQSLGEMHGIGSSIGAIATGQLYARHLREARHNYEIALQIFQTTDDHISITRTLSNLAIVDQELGDYATALVYLGQAIEGYRDLEDRHGEAAALVNLARLYHRKGDTADARQAAAAAIAACTQYGFPQELERLPEPGR